MQDPHQKPKLMLITTSITYKMRKKSNLVPRIYWLSDSLDCAEHNKYIVKISMSHKLLESELALGTRVKNKNSQIKNKMGTKNNMKTL